ncbi:MAG: glutamine--fructose-6-phosphate transaminase (isomerizing) [Candidatus Altiarchaeota archaeon]|nr:glutamine--fructose-6-phosphate transaminase (isomerizing) [Candidatus Altiarchaeota archaeon]
MCGIAGYVGDGNATERLFEMLKRLEYRGYDSAGVALVDEGITIFKDKGRVDEVRKKAKTNNATSGIGHSRWATHGEPSQYNAHPHSDCKQTIAVVHNGIIENYSELRDGLRKRGHRFSSETDSEVIAHLIEEGVDKGKTFEEAFVGALKKFDGSYAISAIYSKEPEKILIARNESPLIVGIGEGENFVASDIPAILQETRRCLILEDLEYGIVEKDKVVIKDLRNGKEIVRGALDIDIDVESAEKEGHEHFMLKEILEESAAVKNVMRSLSEVRKAADIIRKSDKIYFVACGTAYHAALGARYLLQEYGILSHAEVASEFRYSTVKGIDKDTVLILVSQSGETADTLAAAKEAKKKGAKIISVVNVVGSTLTRISDAVLYTYSGPEIAVASTKAYLGQLTLLILLSLEVLKKKGKVSKKEFDKLMDELKSVPQKIDVILDNRERIKEISKSLILVNDYFYIARRLNFPTALEGALKLKEISYLHAEAYPAGELKHGPLALMEEKVCVIAINPSDALHQKMSSNIQEVRARKAKLLELHEDKTFTVKNGADVRITVPATNPILSPLVFIVPLHLLAYYIAVEKGLDIDKPRNLAKSVTVE